MSHLKYMKELNSLTCLSENIKGPMPRWQKKYLETSNSSINASSNSSRKAMSSSSANSTTGKTPTKHPEMRTKKTPSKSVKKSPSRASTPAKTPSGGDRFIPSRSTTNFDLGHYKLQQASQNTEQNEEKCDNVSPSKKEMQRLMGENFHGGDINNMRVLSYQNKAPAPPEGYQNPLRVVYSQTKTPAGVKASTRYIPQAPDRILDAPDIVDDYYLNLIDWSPNNVLAVALGGNIYLWNAGTGTIEQLLEMEGNDYVCSVGWIQEGPYLAVGTTSGNTELWDCSQMKRVRIMNGHSARVGSLAWNSHILTSGCRSGQIVHHDVRQRDHLVSSMNAHTQEVCGLKWSPDGKYLASGGNDNMLQIWASLMGQNHSHTQPLYSLNQHQAAVKALSWCPWQNNILASGGGTADRTIRFWNCNTGACLNSVDTKSQVCALLWSTTYKEIVSGHGYAQNQLTIWKYPAMNKVAELTGHSSRVLHLAMSPDGTTVLSAGADETLRLWKCFQPDPHKKKELSEVKAVPSKLKQLIR
ncbi:cell division cycle protein 20 homolog [Orussus abietinus]|uniref:cell division cycle protein 20 homolog n=1 Tax=Orussus abietinus TaxID=222816 RepID=UPI0006264D08|nr:cell division cycle protein 20 homolog [Orussus abietinus]XP_012276999.1 cell division cycle protein 20 homolog [Orussus abietinus]XP_012277000.1 cell division cycle protein 20 homolog [Orussus abietinus]XP_012277001.1 cell division cycle protein 20 homolog [Orussus abietinus]XP_012277002.1 cell division cycle protein 20 homolog [Orussus abietinus]XP_012277003.1 cell division cycle protein 20 homolog [Orussus abietinus]XP_012277004.1 cell division cycle protein 20 homolog [Orussus abietinu